MLRVCALKYKKSWDKSLPYAEFSYNNSYQASIKMAPYEALYERQCRTPLFWSQTGERQVFGPEVLKDVERHVQMVCESLEVAQSRQKSYADKRRRDHSPMRGTRRFKVKGKLAPRYVGPFKIVDRIGEVAYQLELPPQLSDMHDVFVIPRSEKEGTKPLYVCPGCSNHTYSNNMITRIHVQ
jgi:hypothetical protein